MRARRSAAYRTPTTPIATERSTASTIACAAARAAAWVSPYGVSGLRIISGGFLFYAYGMVLTQSFNGAGDTWTPTVINLFVFWLFELPLAYLLATRTALGPLGVFTAMAVSYSSLAVVSALVFRRGRWKQKVV